MMIKFRFIQILLLFCIGLDSLSAQLVDIGFRQISPPGGFTLKAITRITQDDLGYIWMGTNQGLIRFDSKQSVTFMPSASDTMSLPGEDINDIYSDINNDLWVATNKGLCKFNRQNQNFKRINYSYEDGSKSAENVLSIIRFNNNKMLIIDDMYFGYFDSGKNIFHRIGIDKLARPLKLYKDLSNRIWIANTRGDIYIYSVNENRLSFVFSANVQVNSIYTENNFIWLGTDGEGVKQYSLSGDLVKQISFGSTALSASGGNVRVILKDTYGRQWFGTYEGLFMHDGNELINFNPDDYSGMPHSSIYEIFEDRHGGIWIGTWSGGVMLVHHSDNNFKTFRHSSSHNSVSNNTISSIQQLNERHILIGTEVGGLNLLDLKTEHFEKVPISPNQEIINVKSLCKDKQGGIWVGTFRQGLWYRPPGKDEFVSFTQGPEDGNNISSSSVYSLCSIDSGVIIGTFRGGVNFFNFNTKKIEFNFNNKRISNMLSNSSVLSILADSKQNIWLGTTSGLYKIKLLDCEITKFSGNSYSEDHNYAVYHIFEHSNGKIWIGTKNNGIHILNHDYTGFETFYADGILKGKDVYGIIEDHKGQTWITSNNGLVVYNPVNNMFRHFLYSDGIQSNLFCPQAVHKDSYENLYFGGTNGFTKINPNMIKMNSRKPYTIINKIITNDNLTYYPNYSENLKIDKLVLNPEETTFRINFSADNYLMPDKNKYRYRLINYYNDWIETQNDGSILFKSLKPGDYIFEVKACNNDGIWNDIPTQMHIKIRKHWYNTNLSYSTYLLLFAFILYFIGKSYTERIKLKRAVLLEKDQRYNEEQVHEMKLKFFTNISHEFRTPLTLISWPLKRLLAAENLTDEQREELEVVNRNSNRLLQLIKQIIDIRKLDKGKSKLNISKIELIGFLKKIQQAFLSEIKRRNIQIIFDSSFDMVEIEADEEKLDTIFFNLLSNAFKFVPENGKIIISVKKEISTAKKNYSNQLSFGEIQTDDFVEIAIEDSGLGIDSEDLLKIFNRFEQGKQGENRELEKNNGSGIGLSICKDFTLLHYGKIIAQSNPGKGTLFAIILPSKQKAQKMIFESHHKIKNYNTNPDAIQLLKTTEKSVRSTILVVEDNIDFNGFICKFLKEHYDILSAINGVEALQILKRHSIDLIVSDVMMPRMDGFEFCRTVKTQIETSHIPIILLTALSSSENLITGLDRGVDAYITKPFNEDVLLIQIENILKQRKRLHDNFTTQYLSKNVVDLGSLDNFFLKRVKVVVEKNIALEDFSMEDLAEELMISRTHLHRKIKSLTGLTTTEFVNLIRVKKAVKLIQEDNYLLNEVAFLVGFSSQSYFNKCFKKVYEVSPREYFGKNSETKNQ